MLEAALAEIPSSKSGVNGSPHEARVASSVSIDPWWDCIERDGLSKSAPQTVHALIYSGFPAKGLWMLKSNKTGCWHSWSCDLVA